MTKTMLTHDQVAERLGITRVQFINLRLRNGGPPEVRVSARIVRWESDVLETWIDERRRKETPADE